MSLTAGAVVSPLLGAAAVNGLCGALVLNGVPCGCDHGRERFYERECSRCAGSGFVAPSVTPGQHLAVIALAIPDCWCNCPPDCCRGIGPDEGGCGWCWAKDTEEPCPRGMGDRTRVIGSVTATTPALPIVAGDEVCNANSPHVCVADDWMLYVDHEGYDGDLSEFRQWLGDDLVGRWAVLIDNPTTTDQRCPNPVCDNGECEHCYGEEGGCGWCGYIGACPTCEGRVTTAPVPLPDGVDLTEGTIVEVDL